ncbi:MAG: M1 family metallopeptidase [Candidatus Promineofilum sp.]|nr:M1 family metallopeptidase [Promineifilum sp.]
MKRLFLLLIIMLAILPACRRAAPALPAGPKTTPATQTATAVPALPTADRPQQPTAQASPLDASPDDRSVYASGLVTAERGVLEALPGAPVYHLEFTIADSLDALEGRQTVNYTNREDVTLEEVYFHLHPKTLGGAMAVSDVTVDGQVFEAAVEDTVLRVPLPAPLPPGETIDIAMRFQTTVPTEIGRNYGVLAYFDDILALAHFYPMLAVYDDEGWNLTPPDIQGDLTYSDAAFYLVRVTAPAELVLVGSGVAVAEESDGDRQTITYALGPARDFFLAAGDFAVTSGRVGETTINSYAPAALAEGAAAALDVASAALSDFSERVAPYPYTELDIVTTPTSALGIEYPGLIVGTLRMYDLDGATADGRPYVTNLESTTAHEVAHQWFYNLVGNDQLDEPWLDESLVSYSTYRYFLSRYGASVADSYFRRYYDRFAQASEELPIGLPVAAYRGGEYGAFVYGRGPVFLRTLEEFMGRDVFDAFLRDYSRRYRWQIVDTEAFRALAEEHCGCDLGPMFAEWVYE